MSSDGQEVLAPPARVQSGAEFATLDDYRKAYQRSLEDPEAFWGEVAGRDYHWEKPWEEVCGSWNFDVGKGSVKSSWFNGGETNMCFNCVDRHVAGGAAGRTAFYWEGNDSGTATSLTYGQLQRRVCQIANYLKSQGVERGDEVAIYMPMVPELPAVMLACTRISALFTVVFAGFSAEALAGRMSAPTPKVLVTCSAFKRGAKAVRLKDIADEALHILGRRSDGGDPLISRVLVLDHSEASGLGRDTFAAGWVEGRDVWWQDVVPSQSAECPIVWVGAEEPLFKLYTSGSTGKPKGVVHTVGGYMVGVGSTFKWCFDHRPGDVFWCTADIGWITGHSYVAFGPLLNGATQVMFEGLPSFPHDGRWWEIVDKHQVSVFYTAPTAIRALQARGDAPVKQFKRSSLRILGTVGEPINPEAWRWYHSVVGDSKCAVVDTWWQTETGTAMISPLPGATPTKPGSATLPLFGVEAALLNQQGQEIEGVGEGYLVMKRPWPAMARTLAGDHARYEQTYFSQYNGYYFTGDGARRDEDGYYWISGRVDDVMNVSGHRIGTAEVESALVTHPLCAEAAVVGCPHAIKGEGIYAFVTLMAGTGHPPPQADKLKKELADAVRKAIGPIATPDTIHWAPGLPKTRSGKIMRRVLRKIAAGKLEDLGDTSTLADPGVVSQLVELRGK